jgi:HEPN domain-containing protein
MSKKFTWHRYPENLAEFEALMTAVDAHLSSADVKPHQRPFHVGPKLWEAFGWGGNIAPPDSLANEPGFQGDVLMAKAHRWYEETLGSRLKKPMEMGQIPVMLARTVWRLRIIEFFGTVKFFFDRDLSNDGDEGCQGKRLSSVNVLTLIDQLPQGLVDRLPDSELIDVLGFYLFAMRSIEWRNNLPLTPLLQTARGDFDSSSQEIFACRYGQARWAVQQAVEKTLKGLLTIGGTEFKTYGKEGHDLATLAGKLRDNHQIEIDSQLIETAHCATHVRYGTSSTLAEAVAANHAALSVFRAIKDSDGFVVLMQEGQAAGRF